MNRRDQGFILVVVLIMTILGAGLSGAILGTSFSYHRASREMLQREQAYWASESGASYYLSRMAAQPGYFNSNPAPHAAVTLNGSSFRLETAQPVAGSNNQWQVLIHGTRDGTTYPLNVILGHRRIPIPDGIVATGTGSSSALAIQVQNGTKVGSYDPLDGAYDPMNPGQDANIAAKGGVTLASSTIYGDLTVTGTAGVDASSWVGGDLTAGAPDFPVDDIDPIVYDAMAASKVSNNNAALAGVFGAQWKPVSGTENYGDLIVTTKTTYVIPAGTYRFRRFEVRNGATVVFNTSSGPSRVVYVGSGKGTGTLNDLIVTGSSAVKVNSGSTYNGLLTVLGPDCDFMITSSSVFGQSTGDPENAGYTQIISLGGDTSSDDIKVTTGSEVYGRLYAASHLFTLDSASWYGSALARTVSATNSTFAVDVGSLGTSLTDPSDFEILARWPATG